MFDFYKMVKSEESDSKGENTQSLKEKLKSFFEEKKTLPAVVLIIVLLVAFFLLGKGGNVSPQSTVNMSFTMDLGAITIRGDGMPGYDVDRNNRADYLEKGFGYYKGLYEVGGFEYGPGELKLEEFGVDIGLPVLSFAPVDITESSVGSVVEFSAEDPDSDLSVSVILKTLGPSLTTYNLFIENYQGETYGIVDSIGVTGSGTIEPKEVEIQGKHQILE